ncbi:MAG: radical SAM protein [Chloroflexi bacterium]|nr:radical SAM protein [Chloroflexota bacterium]MBE3118784.1 radical SAM protein [Candidatus Atribacteria bacterium]
MIGNADKVLAYPDRLATFAAGDPVMPITAEVHPSGRCNQCCRYCKAPKSGLVMTAAEADDLARQMEEVGIRGVTISGGGEPTLGPWRSFLGRKFSAGLITNGDLPVSEYSGLSWVRFSVDSCRPETYRKVRGVEWPDCLEDNIRRAIEQTRVGIQAVITPESLDDVVWITSWARRIGAAYIHIRPNDYSDNPTWFNVNLTALLTTYNRNERFKVIIRDEKRRPASAGVCYAGHFRITIAPDLNCYVCACGMYRKSFGRVGKNDTLAQLLSGHQRAMVLREHDRALCPSGGCVGAGINRAFDGLPEHEFL